MAPSTEPLTLATSPRSLKRRASSPEADFEEIKDAGAKRQRMDYSVATPPETPAVPSRQERQEYFLSQSPMPKLPSPPTDRITDIINTQFGHEILLRHGELRFINQELAKCQAALEQLRRCHLIPYPITCPTPQQMLDIVDGKVPAVQSPSGEPTPAWAPPYGVVDGPYARHYAKWLIPDSKFDGQIPAWRPTRHMSTVTVEGRSTRNSASEDITTGKRVSRGQTGHKITPGAGFAQSLPPPPPKVKGPCIMKRSDGVLVKLVCYSCHRENFSSVQGFINHVRISHKMEFRSHEEAAVHCGHPIDEVDGAGVAAKSEEKVGAQGQSVQKVQKAQALQPAQKVQSAQPAQSVQYTGGVHPLARTDATAGNAYAQVLQRIESSLKLFHQGRLPGVSSIPGTSSEATPTDVARKPSKSFVGSSRTPFLSQLLQSRNFKGDLEAHVEDAKTTDVDDDALMSGDESDEGELVTPKMDELAETKAASAGARMPVMRVPARAPAPSATEQRPTSSKGRSPHLSLSPTASKLASDPVTEEDASVVDEANMMDIDRSPITATSNNAPSLVSDDGGDDSDDASSSSDASDADAMSDVAEVNIEYPEIQDHIAQHAGKSGNGSRALKKDEARHVTFVTPVTGKAAAAAAARRKPRV